MGIIYSLWLLLHFTVNPDHGEYSRACILSIEDFKDVNKCKYLSVDVEGYCSPSPQRMLECNQPETMHYLESLHGSDVKDLVNTSFYSAGFFFFWLLKVMFIPITTIKDSFNKKTDGRINM